MKTQCVVQSYSLRKIRRNSKFHCNIVTYSDPTGPKIKIITQKKNNLHVKQGWQ